MFLYFFLLFISQCEMTFKMSCMPFLDGIYFLTGFVIFSTVHKGLTRLFHKLMGRWWHGKTVVDSSLSYKTTVDINSLNSIIWIIV